MDERGVEGVRDPSGRGWLLARRIARYSADEPSIGPLDDALWSSLLESVSRERLGGLLVVAIREGRVIADHSQLEEAISLHLAGLRQCLVLERALLRIRDALAARDVPLRALKGVALAHLDYGDPSERLFHDIDVLVPSEHLDLAVATLGSIGFHRQHPEPRRNFQRRFGKGVALANASGVEVDVHRTLAMGPFGLTIPEEDLWASSSRFMLAGSPVDALDRSSRFLHACIHAAVTRGVRLWIVSDVARLHAHDDLVVEEVKDRARSWGIEAAVGRALALAEQHLEHVGPLTSWAPSASADRRSARLLAAYEPTTSAASRTIASLRALSGVRDRAAFLFATLLPDRSFLDRHGTTRRARVMKAARQVIARG